MKNKDFAGATPGVTDVIGVKSLMSNPSPGCSQIAGWFEAIGGGAVLALLRHMLYTYHKTVEEFPSVILILQLLVLDPCWMLMVRFQQQVLPTHQMLV